MMKTYYLNHWGRPVEAQVNESAATLWLSSNPKTKSLVAHRLMIPIVNLSTLAEVADNILGTMAVRDDPIPAPALHLFKQLASLDADCFDQDDEWLLGNDGNSGTLYLSVSGLYANPDEGNYVGVWLEFCNEAFLQQTSDTPTVASKKNRKSAERYSDYCELPKHTRYTQHDTQHGVRFIPEAQAKTLFNEWLPILASLLVREQFGFIAFRDPTPAEFALICQNLMQPE